MICKIIIKRAIKKSAGYSAILAAPFTPRSAQAHAGILVYHRVAPIEVVDPNVDDWNVPPRIFERQIAALSDFAEIVPLLELPARLKAASSSGKPLVSLTFDDGYANFQTRALPILLRYKAPATVFTITSLIGEEGPLAFDDWSVKYRASTPPETWQAMNWRQLEICATSGLVTIGSHSHRHPDARHCQPEQLIEEAALSREILRRRLGDDHARAYAYPYGCTRLGQVPPAYAEAVRQAGFETAVTTDLGLADVDCDPFLLPRIEAHALDSPAVLRAKVTGAFALYRLVDRMRGM